jgi:hypothetical protein
VLPSGAHSIKILFITVNGAGSIRKGEVPDSFCHKCNQAKGGGGDRISQAESMEMATAGPGQKKV